ncbi:MAG: Uma2 family endonuclease [Anaerolineae bacterium]
MREEDFFRLCGEDDKAELIDGVMVIATPASYAHERLFGFLYPLLGIYTQHFNLGEVLGSRTPVWLEEGQVYEPDILFIARERVGIIGEQYVQGAPDLVVEILSAGSVIYDRGRKREVYERSGVKELWLIDPYGPAGSQFFQRVEEGLREVEPVEGIYHSAVLPGFWLKKEWLWPEKAFPEVLEVLRQLKVI